MKAQDKFALTQVRYGGMQLPEFVLQASGVRCHFGGIKYKEDAVNLLIQGGIFYVATYCIIDCSISLELK